MAQRLAGAVRKQVLLRHIRDVFGFRVLGVEMIERLVLARPPFSRDRLVPFLGIGEDRIDIENDATERVEPVADDLANRVLGGVGLVHDGIKIADIMSPRTPIHSSARHVNWANDQGIVTLASLMTPPHRAVSSAKNLAASAGEPIIGSSRSSRSRLSTSGFLRMSTTSRLMRAARSADIFGGPTMANQVIERNPGNPDSSIVGSSLTDSTRSELATAMILILSPR